MRSFPGKSANESSNIIRRLMPESGFRSDQLLVIRGRIMASSRSGQTRQVRLGVADSIDLTGTLPRSTKSSCAWQSKWRGEERFYGRIILSFSPGSCPNPTPKNSSWASPGAQFQADPSRTSTLGRFVKLVNRDQRTVRVCRSTECALKEPGHSGHRRAYTHEKPCPSPRVFRVPFIGPRTRPQSSSVRTQLSDYVSSRISGKRTWDGATRPSSALNHSRISSQSGVTDMPSKEAE